MRRFYFDPQARYGEMVVLSEEESRHISKVLRLKAGSTVELFDGTGTLYEAVVSTIGRRVEVRISGVAVTVKEDARILWVRQGLLKGEKMDMVIQKCTELGVTGMTPFHSSRCQGKHEASQSSRKHERWRRISLGACKQCLRLQPMQLDAAQPFSYLFGHGSVNDAAGIRLLFWEEEKEVHLQDIAAISTARSIDLLFGPEGGLALEEVELARSHGWRTVGLGDRILRAETATLSGVAIVQYLAGNLRGKG